jgi:phage virion morphogenesis protein
MTINTEIRKAGPYQGDGAATRFPFAFKVFTASDLLVLRSDAEEIETALVLDADYSVTLSPEQNTAPGGTPFTPRKRKGKGIRAKMFQKLKSSKWLKARVYPREARISFGSATGLASIHHYGLRGRLVPGHNDRIQYPARPLLGFSENDKSLIEDAILESFRDAL